MTLAGVEALLEKQKERSLLPSSLEFEARLL